MRPRVHGGEEAIAFVTNPVVVVTGGGRGIGRAICRRFAAERWSVIASSRSEQELEETRRLIEREGGHCQTQVADVCSPPDIDALIESAVSKFGRIDVLINNAGIAPNTDMEGLEPSLFETLTAVNMEAVYYACRTVWPVMRRQGAGVIINVSSIASTEAFDGFAAYGASKAWVNAWTRGIAEEGKPLGIRAFAVAPGAVETKMLRDTFPDYPRGQALDPSEVAELVFSLTRSGCQYSSGQTVFIKKETMHGDAKE